MATSARESTGCPSLTELLKAWEQGDQGAFGSVMRHVNGELHRMALSRLRGADTPSLAAGDLLNEAVLKLMGTAPHWRDRSHFFATVAVTMRSILVDHARARAADKRGGQWQRVTYTMADVGEESPVADLLTLDALLTRLEAVDARAFKVLQLTYFGGLARDEIAVLLDLSVPTIDRELRFARAWLSAQLQRDLEA